MDTHQKRLPPWKTIKSESGPDLPLFEVELRHMTNPRNGSKLKAVVLHSPDTVNIIALTPERSILLVEQFRFGINENLLELPAGLIDGEETPLSAARRELREETGFHSENWVEAGVTYLNPAYVTNKCYHYIAFDAIRVASPKLDESENIALHVIPHFDPEVFIDNGVLHDAIGVAALAKVGLIWRNYD